MHARHFPVDIACLLIVISGLGTRPSMIPASLAGELGQAQNPDQLTGDPMQQIADSFVDLIRDAIPRAYERKQDWGKTKRIPVGIQNTGHGLKLRIRTREKEVNHGVWKHYRVTMINPEDNLHVRIENLRGLGPGHIGLTIGVSSKVHGWARAKVYYHGLHMVGLTAEGDTTFDLIIHCEIKLRFEPTSFLIGFTVEPEVTRAELKLKDFHLTRVGELDGPLIHELGHGLRHLLEDELKPAKLTQKLNRAIDKKQDRLRFSPDEAFLEFLNP